MVEAAAIQTEKSRWECAFAEVAGFSHLTGRAHDVRLDFRRSLNVHYYLLFGAN